MQCVYTIGMWCNHRPSLQLVLLVLPIQAARRHQHTCANTYRLAAHRPYLYYISHYRRMTRPPKCEQASAPAVVRGLSGLVVSPCAMQDLGLRWGPRVDMCYVLGSTAVDLD